MLCRVRFLVPPLHDNIQLENTFQSLALQNKINKLLFRTRREKKNSLKKEKSLILHSPALEHFFRINRDEYYNQIISLMFPQ